MKNLNRIYNLKQRIEALSGEVCLLDFLTRLSCRTYDKQEADCVLSDGEENSIVTLENMTDNELSRIMPLLYNMWVTGMLYHGDIIALYPEIKKLKIAKLKREFYSKVEALRKSVGLKVAIFQVWEEAAKKYPGLFKTEEGLKRGYQRWAADRRKKQPKA